VSARTAGLCAILAAVCGELYSISFVIVTRSFSAMKGMATPPAMVPFGLALPAGGGAAAHGRRTSS
jgi:hypothetical protein